LLNNICQLRHYNVGSKDHKLTSAGKWASVSADEDDDKRPGQRTNALCEILRNNKLSIMRIEWTVKEL